MKLTKEQTQTIIDNGKLKGLSGKAVLDGLISRGYEPEGIDIGLAKQAIQKEITPEKIEEKPNMFERVKEGIKEKGKNVAEIAIDPNKSTLEKITGAGAEAASSISTTAYNALPDVARGVLDKVGAEIGKGMEYLVDKISNNKFLQEAAMSGNTQKLEEGLKIVSDLGVIAGEAAGVKVGTKALQTGADLTKTGINKATDIAKRTVKDIKINPEELAKYPTKIADSISEKITRIDPKVKNILDTASIEKFDNYVKAGEEALKNPRALTPLEKAGDVVKNKILPTIKEDLGKIGSQKAKSLSSVGATQVPNATLDIIDYIKNTTKGLKLTAEENKLIKQAISDLQIGKSPTLTTLDKTVDLLQSTLFEKSAGMAIPTTSRVKSIINSSIGKLNDTVKKAAKTALKSDEYATLNTEYATRVKLFNNLNKLLGEEGKRGGSLLKRFFSPQDSGTKKIFAQIKDLYGVDLAEDATLAKFVMESLGDSRASSLLQMVPLSKGGAVTKAISFAEQKLTKPIKKARKIIESKSQAK